MKKTKTVRFTNKVRTTIGLAAMVFGFLYPRTLLRAQSAGTTSTATAALQLTRDIPTQMKKGNVPGMSIALIRGGTTTWLHGFAVKNTKTGGLVTLDTSSKPLH
jgi:CubicO group peptidase (beta-lactamase class C family)